MELEKKIVGYLDVLTLHLRCIAAIFKEGDQGIE